MLDLGLFGNYCINVKCMRGITVLITVGFRCAIPFSARPEFCVRINNAFAVPLAYARRYNSYK